MHGCQLVAEALLLTLEQVERDGVGVVRLEELEALGFELLEALRVPLALLFGIGLLGRQFGEHRPGGGVETVGGQLELAILVFDLSLDHLDRAGLEHASGAPLLAAEADCNKDGQSLEATIGHAGPQELAPDLRVDCSFSSKPQQGYPNYYEKMTAYAAIFTSHAQAIAPSVRPQTYAVVETDDEDDVFLYLDTASSRAGIGMANEKLRLPQIAIVGVGGTGSYVLDLVVKAPVKEIHTYDGDIFYSHNAFRSPGAASLDDLRAQRPKTEHHQATYAWMRRGVISHSYFIDENNVDELQGMDFVFLCIDAGESKRVIVEKLEEFKVPFVDCGIGVDLVNDQLIGSLRVTSSVPGHADALHRRVSLDASAVDADYDRNIQIIELNALSAALAVIKWKKYFGFYADFEHELHTTYTLESNLFLSEEQYEA